MKPEVLHHWIHYWEQRLPLYPASGWPPWNLMFFWTDSLSTDLSNLYPTVLEGGKSHSWQFVSLPLYFNLCLLGSQIHTHTFKKKNTELYVSVSRPHQHTCCRHICWIKFGAALSGWLWACPCLLDSVYPFVIVIENSDPPHMVIVRV